MKEIYVTGITNSSAVGRSTGKSHLHALSLHSFILFHLLYKFGNILIKRYYTYRKKKKKKAVGY